MLALLSGCTRTAETGNLDATARSGSTEPCVTVVDETLAAVQDFLDRLGDASSAQAPDLRPLGEWLDAYERLHHHLVGLEAFVENSLTDDEFMRLAALTASWPGVVSARAVSRDEAVSRAREMFADSAKLLEMVDNDPELIPRSIALTVDDSRFDAIDADLRATAGITDTGRLMTTVETLTAGLQGVGVAEPYLRQPTAEAAESGCNGAVWEGLRARVDELEPHGTAGVAFIAGLR